jgi:hypothetical protein
MSDFNPDDVLSRPFKTYGAADTYALIAEIKRQRAVIAKWRAWWLGMADEAANAGTQSGDYNARLYREIVEDFDHTAKTIS